MTTKQKAEELAGKIALLHHGKAWSASESRAALVREILVASPLIELLEAVEALKGESQSNQALRYLLESRIKPDYSHHWPNEDTGTTEHRLDILEAIEVALKPEIKDASAALSALRDKGVE